MRYPQQRTVPYADPLHAGRHPFQTYMLALCVVSGVPLLFGVSTAGSAEAILPHWVALAWGGGLSGGAAVALAGSYWPRRNYATALTIERIGLTVVGTSALFYTCLISAFLGWAGAVASMIVAGFGLASLTRAHDVGKIMLRAIATSTDGRTADPVLREGEGE